MSLSVGGLISGLDTDSLLSQLSTLEKQPIVKLQQKEAAFQVKLTSYGNLQSALSTLRTAGAALDSSSEIRQFTATSSDSSVFTASAISLAEVGSHSISVQTLAQVHKVKSEPLGINEAVGAGTFSIQLGSGAAVEITTEADDTLEDVANLINEKQSNIRASVITNGDQVYLTLTGQNSGEASTIRLNVIEENGTDPLDLTDSVGLSRLRYAQGGENNHLTQTQAASDAVLTVDGVEGIHRTTNTVSDVIKGITLTLKTTGNGESLTISQNTSLLASKIQEFVKAYNSLVDFFKSSQGYDSENKKAGTLLGDGTTNQIRNKLRTLMSSAITGGAEGLSRLSDLGVQMTKEGHLEIDNSKLNEALNNRFTDVATFFTISDGENKGFATRLVSSLDALLDKNTGSVNLKTRGIQTSIDRIEKDIERYTARVEKTQERLKAQFNSLESLLAKYQSTSDYLAQQITALQSLNNS